MAKQGYVGDLLRKRLRTERERRGWSQTKVTEEMARRGLHGMTAVTVAKIEAGNRGVQVDELAAFSDMFGITIDTMIGRGFTNTDLVWAINKLASTAHKCSNEVDILYQRVDAEFADVRYHAQPNEASVSEVVRGVKTALESLAAAKRALLALAKQFPAVGVR